MRKPYEGSSEREDPILNTSRRVDGIREQIGWAIVCLVPVGLVAFVSPELGVAILSVFILYVAGRLLFKRQT